MKKDQELENYLNTAKPLRDVYYSRALHNELRILRFASSPEELPKGWPIFKATLFKQPETNVAPIIDEKVLGLYGVVSSDILYIENLRDSEAECYANLWNYFSEEFEMFKLRYKSDNNEIHHFDISKLIDKKEIEEANLVYQKLTEIEKEQ